MQLSFGTLQLDERVSYTYFNLTLAQIDLT
jgi:hypothetical protein